MASMRVGAQWRSTGNEAFSLPKRDLPSRVLLRAASTLPALIPLPALAIQPRQAEVLVEKIATGLTAQKVFDKITTVITSQTTVEPEALIKAVTESEPDDAWETFKSEFFDLWTSTIDIVAHFDSAALGQAAQELLADFAEKFASWELSSLVALGERWLIWTPIVLLPMAWEMSSKKQRDADERSRKEQALQMSEAARIKQEQVYRELQRIQLRTQLLDCLDSGKDKQQVEDLARKLSAMRAEESPSSVIDGKWRLVYATRTPGSNFLLPGFEISNLGQNLQLHHKDIEEDEEQQLPQRRQPDASVQNSATIRLGPLGAVEVTLEGAWEHLLHESRSASLSLKGVNARVVEMLGAPITLDLPAISVEVPPQLQQATQWKLLYVDEQVRIDEADNGLLYLYVKSE